MKQQPIYTRREFLRTTGLGLATVNATAPSFLARTAQATDARKTDKILVVLQLSGGNDGLNTVVPFGDDEYYRVRPVISINKNNVLKLGASRYQDYLGFNPALRPLMNLWDSGNMAVINGVGYPNPNRSHFRAMEIWHTASDSSQVENCGWLGRYFDNACAGCDAQKPGIHFANEMPQAMKGRKPTDEIGTFNYLARTAMNAQIPFDEVRARFAMTKDSGVVYPDTRFANGLALIANMIANGLGSRVYYHDQSGFDTHANQNAAHTRLWTEVSEGIAAFFRDLEKRGLADRVLVMSFSEFGRRVAENGSNGTDHGAAAPMFIWGKGVQGGIYGKPPDLTDLDHGDLKWTVDFRSIYASMLDGWLGADHKLVLGRQFPKLPFVVG